MKFRCNLLLTLLALSFIFLSCDNSGPYHWQKANNTDAYIWTKSSQLFDWNGDVKGEFAHGQGTIQFIKNGKRSGKQKKTLFFGADKKEFIKLGSTENLYMGDFKNLGSTKIPNGKGVFVKPNGSVYAGEFSDGKITNGYHFVAEELQYSGSFLDSKYSGLGVYYKNGEILYSGNWLEGKQDGAGTEYHDNAEFKGSYKDGKKEGLFQIERNGTIRVVSFSNNIPDLTDCKIYYNDGTMWVGALTRNYEPSGLGQTITSDGLVNFENRINGELIGEQKFTFPDGSSYEGGVKNGKRNGYGIQVYSTGITYYGNWENDYQNGYGDLDIDDDWYYSGEWKNGLFDGEGYFSFPEFSYEGEWKEGKKDGFGILTLANLQYEGFWKNDAINGEGYISYSDGSYYEGSWKDNKRNGYGEYVWADGSSYYGNWEDDFPNGEGEINLPNGDFYTGEIEYGYFSGAGTYIFANGDRYEGTFVENKKDGIGYYYFANGNSYEGEFKNNQPNGKGRFYFENGAFYDGEFINGRLKGNGSLFIPEENDYTVITSSFWSDNIIPTSGSVLFANGDEFVGTLKNGMPTDDGSWTTREERLKGRSTAQKLREFYGAHQQTIEKAFTITEWVITGINAVATIAEFIPFPPVQIVGAAVDKICDVASCAISGANIAIKTAVLNYDINEIEQNGGSPDEIAELKKQYAKDISGDVLNIAATVGLASIQAIQAGSKAKKALEIYPNLREASKAIEKTGELAKVAKSGKFSDKLIRGTVSVAYGKVGKKLIEAYGDDAAKFLFKYGDNAMYALTDGGETVLKIINKGNEKALKVIFDNGEDAIKILSKNLDNLDDVAEIITKKGKAGIKLLEQLGDEATAFSMLYTKHGDDVFNAIHQCGKINIHDTLQLISNGGEEAAKFLAKKGKDGLDFLKQYPLNYAVIIVKQYEKHGEEFTGLLTSLGRNNQYLTLRVLDSYGDEAFEQLVNINRGNYIKVLNYIDSRGVNGIRQLKNQTVDLANYSVSSMKTTKNLLSKIEPVVDGYVSKGAIKLSFEELESAKNDKAFLRALMKKYDCNDNLDEFLIRLKYGDSKQVESLLGVTYKDGRYVTDGRTAARGFLDSYIRQANGGSNHEFLLTSNYSDYLLNPKWGDDGAAISITVRQLVQKTREVKINGFSHYDLYGPASKAAKEADPLAWMEARRKMNMTLHDLSEVMENSSDIGTLYENVKEYVSLALDQESAEKFIEIWTNVVR